MLGADVDHPSSDRRLLRPVSGVITDQQVTAAAGVQDAGQSPNLFTISDLSHVWIICDVYENDLPLVHLGEFADIHLNAYPDLSSRRDASAISARFSTRIFAPPKCGWKLRIPA